MKINKIKIKINVPVNKLFDFTIDPKNTPRWIDNIVEEKTDNWPIEIGSIYKNSELNGKWSYYAVTKFKINSIFELNSNNGNYYVRYSYRSISSRTSELEYLEWVEYGKLEDPFDLKVLKKLKNVLEDNS